MKNNQFISVIIVNYNSGNKLQESIQSVYDAFSMIKRGEIVIIDNASSDNSLDLVKSNFHSKNNIIIHENTKNLGFATACNFGFKKSSGNFIFFLNPDCILGKNTIKNLLDCLDNQDDIGMVGGFLINPDGTEQAGGRRLIPTPFIALVRVFRLSFLEKRYPRFFVNFNLYNQPLPKEPIEVEAISGACMLIKREVFEDSGLMDEGYFLHCEDLDLCITLRKNGWRIMFVPNARITHYKGTCSRSRPIFVEWHKHKGMIRFYSKFFKHQYPGPLIGLVIIAVWIRFSIKVVYYITCNVINYFRYAND